MLIEVRDEFSIQPEEFYGELHVLTFLDVERVIFRQETLNEVTNVFKQESSSHQGMQRYALIIDEEPFEGGRVAYWSLVGKRGPVYGIELHLLRRDNKSFWYVRVGLPHKEHSHCVQDAVVVHLPRYAVGARAKEPKTMWARLDVDHETKPE